MIAQPVPNLHSVHQVVSPAPQIISLPVDGVSSPTTLNAVSVSSSNHPQSEAEQEPVHQLPPLLVQRNVVQSLQVIPRPSRFMFLDRSQSNQQIPNPNGPTNTQTSMMQSQQTGLPSLVAFRQESFRGSRILQIPSNTELPEANRPLNEGNLQNRNNRPVANRPMVMPIDNIEEDGREENVDENPQGNIEIDVEPDNERQDQSVTDQRISKTARLRVYIQVLFNIFALLCYIFGYLYVTGDLPIEAVFGIAILFVILNLLAAPLKRKYAARELNKADLVFSTGNAISLIIYFSVAFVKIKGTNIPLTPFCLFGVLVLFCDCCKNSMEPPPPSTVLILIAKVIIWIQLFLVALRIDSLGIPWSTVFIPFYFGLLLLAFSSILVIFGSIYAFFTIMRSEGISIKLVVGSIWYIINALYTGVWLAILTEIVKYLDDANGNIQIALRVGFIHSGVLFLYNILLWRFLCRFQEFEVQSEMLMNTSNQNVAEDSQGTAPRTEVQFKVSKEDKTHLVMISPSFYTLIKKHLKNRNDKDLQTLKKELERARLERSRRNLALGMPHRTDMPYVNSNSEAYQDVAGQLAVRNRASEGNAAAQKQLRIPAMFSEGHIELRREAQAQVQPQAQAQTGARQMEERNQSSENLCTICYDNVPNAVLMDCGHGGLCYECALENWKKTDYCILCRRKITKVLKVVNVRALNITKVVESTTKVVEPARS